MAMGNGKKISLDDIPRSISPKLLDEQKSYPEGNLADLNPKIAELDRKVEELEQSQGTDIHALRLKNIELEQKIETVEKLKQNNKDLEQNRNARKLYASLLFILMSAWLIGIYVILILAGKHQTTNFFLSDSVLIAILTTTTANVLGLFLMVTKYLFNSTTDK